MSREGVEGECSRVYIEGKGVREEEEGDGGKEG